MSLPKLMSATPPANKDKMKELAESCAAATGINIDAVAAYIQANMAQAIDLVTNFTFLKAATFIAGLVRALLSPATA